jgi:hypothetical protein
MILHIGGASAGTVLVTVLAIFFLIFAMSFAIGPVPEGKRRFSRPWVRAWVRASLPRMLIAGVFAALVFTGSALSGGGQSEAEIAALCERPLAPLTGNAVTEPRLATAISSMNDIAAAARNGDTSRVQTLWFTTDAHNVSHDIDAPIRLEQPSLASDLCESVIKLENEMAGDQRSDVIERQATNLAAYMEEARDVLSFATSSPIPGASGACANPIGAVTADPLTAERLQTAADDLLEVSGLAGSGEVEQAAQVFAGDAHNITHDIDLPLRNSDTSLAVSLCESVVLLEVQMGGARDVTVIAREAAAAAGILEEAGRALGILQ